MQISMGNTAVTWPDGSLYDLAVQKAGSRDVFNQIGTLFIPAAMIRGQSPEIECENF